MKKKLFENLQAFTRGALFCVLANINSSILKMAIAFALLEIIWLIAEPCLKKEDSL